MEDLRDIYRERGKDLKNRPPSSTELKEED